MQQTAIFLGQATYTDTAMTEAMVQVNGFIRQLAHKVPEAQIKDITQQLAVIALDQWAYYAVMLVVDVPPHALTLFDTVHRDSSYHVRPSQEEG